MPRDPEKRRKAWHEASRNDTYWTGALSDEEGLKIHWHSPKEPKSSQVFCISAFGGLRRLPDGAEILDELLGAALPGMRRSAVWIPQFEYSRRDVLGETGHGTPTNVDVFYDDPTCVVCVESKFVFDASEGFGGCSQARGGHCAGFYGPGSDLKTRADKSCRLEAKDGRRAPRLYWSLGRRYFQDAVFRQQQRGDKCPFAGPHFQLMRNFLFAASCAGEGRRFGVLGIVPDERSEPMRSQVEDFRTNVLLPEFHSRVGVATYDFLVGLLRASPHAASRALGEFLEERMRA